MGLGHLIVRGSMSSRPHKARQAATIDANKQNQASLRWRTINSEVSDGGGQQAPETENRYRPSPFAPPKVRRLAHFVFCFPVCTTTTRKPMWS